MPETTTQPVKINVTWDDLDGLVAELAERLAAAPEPDVVLAISRGGLVPAAIIARELDIRLIDTICIRSYQEDKSRGEVIVEVEVLEVNRTRMDEYGIQLRSAAEEGGIRTGIFQLFGIFIPGIIIDTIQAGYQRNI